MRLREVALGCALGEVWTPGLPNEGTHEEGGANSGPRVTRYLHNAGINVPAAWCAGLVQGCTDKGAKILGLKNPLDDVVREALVADYVSLAEQRGWLIGPGKARRGHLVSFRFGTPPTSWNHIGFLVDRPVLDPGKGWLPMVTCEGNTGASGGREGDGVYIKQRSYVPGRVCFIAWDGDIDPNPRAAE